MSMPSIGVSKWANMEVVEAIFDCLADHEHQLFHLYIRTGLRGVILGVRLEGSCYHVLFRNREEARNAEILWAILVGFEEPPWDEPPNPGATWDPDVVNEHDTMIRL
jgi:hypothetical protein